MKVDIRNVAGGVKTIVLGELLNICAARSAGFLSPVALQVYLGCHILVASRCTAKGNVRFTLDELDRQIGSVGQSKVKEGIEELENLGLLTWRPWGIWFSTDLLPEAAEIAPEMQTDPNRPIPIPRRILRALAQNTRPTEVIAALAHLIRCLFKDKTKVNPQGLVKASWIADVFGVSLRAVKNARKWLISKNFIISVKIHQLVMNQRGACFRVNLFENAKGRHRKKHNKPKNAPPIKKLTCTSTNHNTTHKNYVERRKAGFCKKAKGGGNLKSIHPEELKRVSSMLKLYRQALMAGWFPHHDRIFLENFISAATRARIVAGQNPRAVRIFVGIVKKRLWGYITDAQRERAIRAIRRYEDQHPEAFIFNDASSSPSGHTTRRGGATKPKDAGSSKESQKQILRVRTALTSVLPDAFIKAPRLKAEERRRQQDVEFAQRRQHLQAQLLTFGVTC